MVLYFRFSECSRVLADWRDRSGRSVWTVVKNYAREHGAAGVWMADDSYRLFYLDGAKLRQKSWPQARPLSEEASA